MIVPARATDLADSYCRVLARAFQTSRTLLFDDDPV